MNINLYITKPAHTKYGTIPFPKYNNIEDLLNDCKIWFKKPALEKPCLCVFTSEFIWYGFQSDLRECFIYFKDLPEIKVKDEIRNIITESLNEDLSESLSNRHYKWIGTINVNIDIVNKDAEKKIVLYLTKPCVWSIRSAGIDRAKIWFKKPKLKRIYMRNDKKEDYIKSLEADCPYLCGRLIRKTKELEPLCDIMWQSILDSFNYNEEKGFYYNLSERSHKKGQSETKFIKEFYITIGPGTNND